MRIACECWKARTSFLSLQLMLSHLSPLLLQTLSCGSAPLSTSVTVAFLRPLIIFLTSSLVFPLAEAGDNMEKNHTFLYFAYGSNLLKERLQLKNPSATVHCVARLKDYRLVFGNHKGLASDRWHGGVATIEDSPGEEVWGVVWRMSMADLESLDSQENVTLGAYSPVELSVKTKYQELDCRTYMMNSCVYAPPSPQYLQVIMMGAEQNGLPQDYQEKLRAIQTNMYEGPLPMMADLERARRRAKERVNHRSDA
ncbi:gamma-glutamylcyclotransferase [Sebastes fasciatus]|uniref:gamma-glutamylcyclotransferase n=1 Tax=Sebastes fasciatus TaxID=394691 RepID=UPI003D9F0D4C